MSWLISVVPLGSELVRVAGLLSLAGAALADRGGMGKGGQLGTCRGAPP